MNNMYGITSCKGEYNVYRISIEEEIDILGQRWRGLRMRPGI